MTTTPSDLVFIAATVLVVSVALYSYGLAFFGRGARRPSTTTTRRLFFAILIPCLNEATVIGRTLESLLSMRGRFHIMVLDDASDDGSQDVVRAYPGHMVTLVQRGGADSRIGKGASLNNGYREIVGSNVALLYGDQNVIVTVFDSDSRVPADFLEQVSPYFDDPDVMGVQSEVRMYNATQNHLTFWQNLEFAAWARLFSLGKDRLGSATLGGNGQCVRLSRLESFGSAPWRPSLTEDLDLSLRILAGGGRIRFTDRTYVAQEAVASIRQLIRQRARWVQGHLVAWEHLGAIRRSAAPMRVRLDLMIFLLLPAALAPIAVATIHGWQVFLAGLGAQSITAVIRWYLFAFACMPLTAWVLVRTGTPIVRAAVHAHVFLVYSFFWVIAAARAAWSILRGDRSWAKTSRAPAVAPKRQRLSLGFGRQGLAVALALAIVASSTLLMTIAATSAFETYTKLAHTGGAVPTAGAQEELSSAR